MRLLLQLLSRQQAIIDAASAENRSLTDQEREEFNSIQAKIRALQDGGGAGEGGEPAEPAGTPEPENAPASPPCALFRRYQLIVYSDALSSSPLRCTLTAAANGSPSYIF